MCDTVCDTAETADEEEKFHPFVVERGWFRYGHTFVRFFPGKWKRDTETGELLRKTVEHRKRTGVDVQFVNPEMIEGGMHLLSACFQALRAFERGENRAATPGTEMLLFLAGTRQIRKAIDMVGLGDSVRSGEKGLAVVFAPVGDKNAGMDRVNTDAGDAAKMLDVASISEFLSTLGFAPDHVDINEMEWKTEKTFDAVEKTAVYERVFRD